MRTWTLFLAIMLMVGGFCAGTVSCTRPEYSREKAEKSAERFVQKLSGATGAVECMNFDSDDDGYCTCTMFMEQAPPQSIACACIVKDDGAHQRNRAQMEGCKLIPLVMPAINVDVKR